VINGYSFLFLFFGYSFFCLVDQIKHEHVKIKLKFQHHNIPTSLPGLSLLIQAEHGPKFAKTPMNVDFVGQPFLLHVPLGTLHEETLRPTCQKRRRGKKS
jgi:hypothetical protein